MTRLLMIKIYQDLLLKICIEGYDQSGRDYRIKKEIRIKTPMLRSNLCDYSDAYIVLKGYIAVTNPDDGKRNKALRLKIMHHLSTAFRKAMAYKLTMQKI